MHIIHIYIIKESFGLWHLNPRSYFEVCGDSNPSKECFFILDLNLYIISLPLKLGDTKAFRFSVARTFRSSLVRQIYEAVKIYGSQADIVLNSKSEWNQPAIDRIIVTREV